jgi:hypothetical protein
MIDNDFVFYYVTGMIKIRISSLPYYTDCPRRASINLFRHEIEAAGFALKQTLPGIATAVGTGTHAAAHAMHESILSAGHAGDLSKATEAGIASFKDEIKEGVDYDETTPNNNHAEKQLITLTRSYYHEIIPALDLDKESAVFEKTLQAKLDAETVISGTPDVADAVQIRDLKTGKGTSFEAQTGGYSLLRKSNGSKQPRKLVIDFVPRTPIQKKYPGAHSITYDVNFAEYYAWNIIQTIKRDIERFQQTGDPWAFMPNPKSMLCGQKYCHAYGTNYCKLGGC